MTRLAINVSVAGWGDVMALAGGCGSQALPQVGMGES